jgi:hypothetical protein
MKFKFPRRFTRAGSRRQEGGSAAGAWAACHKIVLLVIGFCALGSATGIAQETIPQRVDVVLHTGKTVAINGVEQVILLDDSLCNVQVLPDKVEFSGEKRGTTVAFVWVKGQRYTILVQVILPPSEPERPRLSQSELDALGNGMAGSTTRAATSPGSPTNLLFSHYFNWTENDGGNRLTINGQMEDNNVSGAPWFNANSASVQYHTPRMDLSLMDFPLDLTGLLDAQSQGTPYTLFNVFTIRGGDLKLRRGANQYEFFSGSTIPSYFLSLQGTRDIAGFTFSRKQSKSLNLYATTAWLNAPISFFGPNLQRENTFFQTLGYNYHPNRHWIIQGTFGASTRGGIAQQGFSYQGRKFSGFASGTTSAASFPLNQMQLLFAGGSSIATGASLAFNYKITGSFYYQHSVTKPAGLTLLPGTSDYLNPHLSLLLTPRQSVTFNYTYTRNEGGLTPQTPTQGNRFDLALNSRLTRRIINTAEATVGALSDPTQVNAQSDLTLVDAVSIPVRSGTLNIGFQHSRNDPSLVSRLNQEINLLSPALQQLFLLDPLGFVNSNNLSPEIRDLLNNLQPTNTQITLQGQFPIRNRLNLSPMVGYYRAAQGLGQGTNSYLLGYNLTYQLTRTIQFQSSLSNMLLWDFSQQGLRRTSVFSFGINKRLSGHESFLHPFQARRATIQGRVFRDNNVNGRLDAGEPGFAGVRVELSDGQTALTDVQGRFSFSGLKPDVYTVTLPLNQFNEPIRVTSSTSVEVDIAQPMVAETDFGIVNFARVMGNVFNDYDLSGKREPDAPGIRQVRLTLSDGKAEQSLLTDSSGDYEIDDVRPGDYRLSIDASTIPANYQIATTSFPIRVAPTSTVVQDVPVQALRSISGRVLMKPTGANGGRLSIPGVVNGAPANGVHNGNHDQNNNELVPLAGVKIAVDHTTVTTDQDGAFVLRNLPAGDVFFQILAARSVPEGVKLPAWRVRLPRDPLFIQGATVTISNPEVIKCIVPVAPDGK